MRRSLKTHCLVILSNHTKSIYEDCWATSDVIHYTGMGLEGVQSLDYMQNKTLYECRTNGVTPYRFEVYESKKYLFRDEVKLEGSPFYVYQPDQNGNERTVNFKELIDFIDDTLNGVCS